MRLPFPLVRGVLIARYKRFLADVRLESGEVVTAACPNTGSMLGLTAPGTVVWLSRSSNPKRKYPHTWEMLDLGLLEGRSRVGINTGRPNALVAEAILDNRIPELSGYDSLRREVAYGRNSRIDILLEHPGKPACYVEVKNVHLSRTKNLAEFPDCRTERGVKHLKELSDVVRAGLRAVMFYLVQRDDVEAFALAEDLDIAYIENFRQATAAGVEALAYCCKLTESEIVIDRALPLVSRTPAQ
jgi:sugar fermentation stimulation protein A